MPTSRRNFLGLAAAAPVALFAATGARAAEAACYDPATLPFSQKSLRRSLGYVEGSSDPRKRCDGCAFFAARTPASCGGCQMLGGAVVSAGAVCNSFAAKAKS
jgi:High potential iron-sulfur protein